MGTGSHRKNSGEGRRIESKQENHGRVSQNSQPRLRTGQTPVLLHRQTLAHVRQLVTDRCQQRSRAAVRQGVKVELTHQMIDILLDINQIMLQGAGKRIGKIKHGNDPFAETIVLFPPTDMAVSAFAFELLNPTCRDGTIA